jgi:hypothetical protein
MEIMLELICPWIHAMNARFHGSLSLPPSKSPLEKTSLPSMDGKGACRSVDNIHDIIDNKSFLFSSFWEED